MPYRSFPNVDRALRQLDRHHAPQPLPKWRMQLGIQADAALASAAEAASVIAASAWRPDFIYDPGVNRFEGWPAA